MIRFSVSGCALVELGSYMSENDMMQIINDHADIRKMAKNVEFIIRTGDRIIEASEDAFYWNGGKARHFEIGDVRWKHLERIAQFAHITIQQGSWYFSFANRWGIGYWYSSDMLKVGWHHGEDPEAIDHNQAMYKRRDYGG